MAVVKFSSIYGKIPTEVRLRTALKSMEEQHIPIERFRLVATRCDQFLTEDEKDYLGKCADCLETFFETNPD